MRHLTLYDQLELTVWFNGAPAGRIEIDGQLAAVSLVVENGRVTRIYAVANPRKLTRLDEPAELTRYARYCTVLKTSKAVELGAVSPNDRLPTLGT